jgi:hypothetical protein
MSAEAKIVDDSPKTQSTKILTLPYWLQIVYPNFTVSPTKSKVIGPPTALYFVYICGSEVIL